MKIQIRTLFAAGMATLAHAALAQSYIAVELQSSPGYGYAGFNGLAGGTAAGVFGSTSRASTWDSLGNRSDVHPSFLDSITRPGTSIITSMNGTLMVGSGRGDFTSNRVNALIWQSGVASLIPMPAGFMSSQALSTDGTMVVGQYVMPAKRGDVATAGDTHAFIYNSATGQFTDLYNGNPTIAYGVSGNQQVGIELKGNYEARLWNGNPKAPIVLHPAGAESSSANATDGVHQVGSVGYLVQKAGEANKKGIRIRYDYATIWSGGAASLQYLSSGYPNSFAMAVNGDYVAGHGIVTDVRGTRGAQHALGWTNPLEPAIDLHSLLPANYTQSWARAVDANGNFVGYAVDSSFAAHAIMWVRVG